MNGNERSMDPGSDPDTAPDLSKNGWPEKFARAVVRRGRPPLAKPKVSTTIRLSPDVIDHFKTGGRGWQTRIDEALREWIGPRGTPRASLAATSELWVGADPGGENGFGLAFLDASGKLRCHTVSSVDEAAGCILREGKPQGMGIDAPMWWSSGRGGGRKADGRIRCRYRIASGTVQSVNSLRGAATVGGVMLALRIREAFPLAGITESHPKALLSALDLDGPRFADRFGIAVNWSNDHERDAAIAAVCAREGLSGHWTTDLALDRHDSEQDPASYWLRPMHYYWPESL